MFPEETPSLPGGQKGGARSQLSSCRGGLLAVIRCEWGACQLGSAHRKEQPGRLCPLGSISQLRAESGGVGRG